MTALVRSSEVPDDRLAGADRCVDGPQGTVGLLEGLASRLETARH